ncbi:hypothetical protein R75483_00587 [Paraburkholderia domus]|nr:hypothetical protein R75483_00587 [Paraburkholderia domus]
MTALACSYLQERDDDASSAYNETPYALLYVVGAGMLLTPEPENFCFQCTPAKRLASG